MELDHLFGPERRATDRFPIEHRLCYRLMEARQAGGRGEGQTVNMSSCGILFTSGAPLPVGERVELAVEWPAQLNENCGLKLVALGRIVRADAERAAIQIEKYDFRTRAAVRAGSAL